MRGPLCHAFRCQLYYLIHPFVNDATEKSNRQGHLDTFKSQHLTTV